MCKCGSSFTFSICKKLIRIIELITQVDDFPYDQFESKSLQLFNTSGPRVPSERSNSLSKTVSHSLILALPKIPQNRQINRKVFQSSQDTSKSTIISFHSDVSIAKLNPRDSVDDATSTFADTSSRKSC